MGRKRMHVRPVYLWSARVKDAVIMRISSYALLRRAPHFSDCTALVCRSWPTPWPRCAAAGLLKTRNQFLEKQDMLHGFEHLLCGGLKALHEEIPFHLSRERRRRVESLRGGLERRLLGREICTQTFVLFLKVTTYLFIDPSVTLPLEARFTPPAH